MPEKHLAAAKQLSEELHAKGKRDHWRNVVETGLLVAAVILALAVLVAVIGGRMENTQRSNARQHQIDQLTAIAQRIDAVTDPTGCVAKRGQANLAVTLLLIDNNNRVIHGLKPNPVPELNNTPCPGEVGGPPLIAPTTSTTKPRTTTRSTSSPPRSTAQTASPTTPTTTTTAAQKKCAVPVSPCPA